MPPQLKSPPPMNKSSDPLSDPEIALRIVQKQQKQSATAFLILGVAYFICFVVPLMHSETILRRVNELTNIVAGISFGLSLCLVALGIRFLTRPNPVVKLVIDLSERVRAIEEKS